METVQEMENEGSKMLQFISSHRIGGNLKLLQESTKRGSKAVKIAFSIAYCHFRLPVCNLKRCFNAYRSALLDSRDSSRLPPIRCVLEVWSLQALNWRQLETQAIWNTLLRALRLFSSFLLKHLKPFNHCQKIWENLPFMNILCFSVKNNPASQHKTQNNQSLKPHQWPPQLPLPRGQSHLSLIPKPHLLMWKKSWTPKMIRYSFLDELHHEKTCFCHMQTTKMQISLRICVVWSMSCYSLPR